MDQDFRTDDDDITRPHSKETRDEEHGRVRPSNERDQALERGGEIPPHNRGYDKAVEGRGDDTDPDRADADIDRDDTLTD